MDMRQSHSKDLKSFFGTLVAHGNPRAHSLLGRSTLHSTSQLDTGLNAAGTTLQIAKDVGEMANKVPYVKAVAGVLSQIIRIRDDIQANDERCREIIDLVQLKSRTILLSLDQVYVAKGAVGLENLKSDLEDYADFLCAVLREELEPFKTQSRWTSYINRGKNSGDLQKLERELDNFNNRFSLKRLVEISVRTSLHTALPPSPDIIIGRPGGIGKTTVGITCVARLAYLSLPSLLPLVNFWKLVIADAFAAYPVLLYIDNLETVWEVESEKPKVDRFLEVLSGASSTFAILITMRGTQKPNTSFSWNSTVLGPLDSSSSMMMYEALSRRPADTSAQELLIKLSGSPLAIKLLASMVEEGDGPTELLKLWEERGPKMLDIAALVGFYVGTITKHSDYAVPTSQNLILPEMANIRELVLYGSHLQPLPRFVGRAGTEYARYWNRLSAAESSLACAVELYRDIQDQLGEANALEAMGDLHMRRDQLNTADALLTRALELHIELGYRLGEANARSSIGYLHMRRDQLDEADTSFTCALELYVLTQDRQGEANSHYVIGKLHMRRDQLSPASASFAHALELFVEIQDRQGEGNAHESIGDIYLLQNQLDVAELSFARALELHVEVGDRMGEANTYKSVGMLHMRRNQLNAAGTSFTRALDIYSMLQHRLGEANTHKSIGDLHLRQNQLNTVEASLARAMELYVEIGDRLGEANTHMSMGNVHMRQDQLKAAGESFTHALELFGDIQDREGVVNAHYEIGNLHMRRGHLDVAKTSLTLSLEQYREIESRWGIAACTFVLGEVCLRECDLETAGSTFSKALTLWEEIGHPRNIAEIHQAIGELHLHRMQLDEAEASLSRASDMYNAIGASDSMFEAQMNRSLGKLYVLRGQWEESERVYQAALELDTAASSRTGQGKSFKCLGGMFMKKGDLEAAEPSYSDALRLLLEADDYQASSCLLDLGKVWVQQGKIKESESEDVELLRSRWDVREIT
ncbi:hypothetical protein DL96DRAFT_1686087 [Flagelloscypha sp. PMI_526]|nr:hypothetical protein DL96DRAFT_1686087 [Flagelloscypha sp. PMI_526]